MSESLLDKASHSLLRTNPKLTTNIKIVSNGEKIYLESFNANSQLSSSKFKSFKVDSSSTYDKDLHRFYQNGQLPTPIAYDVFQQFSNISILPNYGSQYEMFYSAGARSISSESYDEDLGILAPLWLNEQIPNYFVIFRLDGPASVLNTNSNNENENEILAQSSENFSEFILNNCTAVKTVDLTLNSEIGKYIRNYREQKDFPVSPLTVSWRRDEPIKWNGISYLNGGFTSNGEFSYEDLVTVDSTIIENEYFFSKGFELNGVVCANLLNLEFLFTDENADDFSLNRYFGLYVNDIDEGSFSLDGEGFYKTKEFIQTPRINSINEISKDLNEPFEISNENGVLLYTKDVSTVTGFTTSNRVNEVESIFYVKDKDNNFHSIKRGSKWNENQIRLFDKKIDISTLTGYTDSIAFSKASLIEKRGRAFCSAKVLEELPDGITITFYDKGIYVGEVNANNSTIQIGSSEDVFFNSSGTPQEIVKSIAGAINSIVSENKFFSASYNNDTLYVQSDFGGSRFNDLSFFIDFEVFPEAIDKIETYPIINNTPSNFVGGTDTKLLLKLEEGDQNIFTENRYVKTKDGYSKLLTYLPYLEEPIFNDNNEIIGYTDIDKFILIGSEEKDIFLTSTSQLSVYEEFRPSFGRFSFFPIKDFDYDFLSTLYSNNGELDYETLYYNQSLEGSIPPQYIGIASNPDIREFYSNGGFFELLSVLKDATADEDTPQSIIASEYERLEENYLKNLAVDSKIIPYINKWGYAFNGKDTRNHPYRLNLSLAFGLFNFAPGKRSFIQKPDSFSHEWFYLSKIPDYFNNKAIEESWSYFNEIPVDSIQATQTTSYVPGTFQNVNVDYFTEYFVADKLNKPSETGSVLIDRQIRFGRFRGGDSDNFSETFLRGVRIIAKRKANNNKPNFNAQKLSYVRDASLNDYKFSAMLVINPTTPKEGVKIIKNDKWKTITMLIFSSLKDECINENKQWIDRTSLYSLKNKYSYNENCEVIESTSGSFDYLDGQMSGALSFIKSGLDGSGQLIIVGQENINDIATNFIRDIRIGNDGNYTPIRFTIEGDVYVINVERIISKDKLVATAVTKNGSNFTLPKFSPNNLQLRQASYETVNGGFNEYVSNLNEISFGDIIENVNIGNPAIEYETVDENGNPILNEDGTLAQTFSIELRTQDEILKSVYLDVIPDPNKPTIFNLIDIIGYDLALQKNPRIVPIARHSGFYEPISRDVIFFRDPYLDINFDAVTGSTATGSNISDEVYKKSVLELMRYKNTQFYSNREGFGEIEKMFYHKVNEEDSSTVLELSAEEPYRSIYPLINETAIDYRDFYIFSSNWEPGYFRKSIDKTENESVIGTRSMIEKSSFLGSKYMKVPEQITLEQFEVNDFNENAILDTDLINGNSMVRENNTSIEFYLFIKKKLIEFLFPDVKESFLKYINPEFGFGSVDSLDDDVIEYINNNILKLYKISEILLYVKNERSNESNDYTTAELSNTDKISQGLIITDNFSSKILNNNQFDTRLIYNKRIGFKESFGFSVTLLKK